MTERLKCRIQILRMIFVKWRLSFFFLPVYLSVCASVYLIAFLSDCLFHYLSITSLLWTVYPCLTENRIVKTLLLFTILSIYVGWKFVVLDKTFVYHKQFGTRWFNFLLNQNVEANLESTIALKKIIFHKSTSKFKMF